MCLMLSRAWIIQSISKATIKVHISGMSLLKFFAEFGYWFQNSFISLHFMSFSFLHHCILSHFCLETLFPLVIHDRAFLWCLLDFSQYFFLFVCFQLLFFITYICHRKISYYLLLLLYLFFPSFMHIHGLNFLAYQIDFLASETLFDSRSFTSLPRNSFSASNSVRAKLEHFYLSHICQCSFLLSFIKSTTKWEAHLDTTPNTLSESTFPLFPKQNHQQNLLNLLLIFRYTPILHFISFL